LLSSRAMSDTDPKGPLGTEKTRILSGLTHELRTPLGSILMMSELLAENASGHLDARETRYAQNIHRAAADLLELINQLGELSRVEAGRTRGGETTLEPRKLAERLEQRFAAHAADAGTRLLFDVAPGVPATVPLDGEKVERIVVLLLESALKVSAEGAVRVEIGAGPDDAPGGLEIRVRDSGEPLSEAERRVLFVPFGAAGARSSRQFGGSGLGLPLAHALAELLGGSLAATAARDGCRLTLRLPPSG